MPFKKGNKLGVKFQKGNTIGKQTRFKSRGSKFINSNGYVVIYKPKHPFSNKSGCILEHRLVMEKQLGRYLTSKERVHHRNAIKTDNRIKNLELVGNPHLGKVECPFCHKNFLIR